MTAIQVIEKMLVGGTWATASSTRSYKNTRMTRELEDNILRSQLADTSPRTLVAPEHVFAGMLLVVVIATVFVVW